MSPNNQTNKQKLETLYIVNTKTRTASNKGFLDFNTIVNSGNPGKITELPMNPAMILVEKLME